MLTKISKESVFKYILLLIEAKKSNNENFGKVKFNTFKYGVNKILFSN